MNVVAVGLAHRPGRNTWRGDITRALMRFFMRLLHMRTVPLCIRQRLMFGALNLARWIGRNPILSPICGASKGNSLENSMLKLLFNATAIANVADNAASSPLTNLYASLHTGDPGEAGDQTTSESAYTSYARVAVARTTGGFTVTANSVSPVAQVNFPVGTGGSGTVTHFGIGTASSGAGVLWYSGTVTPNIVTGNTITPSLATTTAITED